MADALDDRLQTLADLWREIRPPELRVPARDAFDPMRLRGLLAHVHLLEFHGPERLIYRLSGTAEVQRLGEDPKGKDYFALVDVPAAAYLRARFHELLFHPAGVLVTTLETYPDGTHTPTRFLALPLRDYSQERDFVLALVAVSGQRDFGRHPFLEPARRAWSDHICAVETCDVGFGRPDVPSYRRDRDAAAPDPDAEA